ncbi:glycosyltransferase family 4 protein [Elioraea sp. Yellowstone]|jgi:glycosyltransferase involved in cell wall biosynthesis|uniref:glycosyltransferase n=1 Tax=Elioraea sp. Yellowstone TaxID=2592070 RepID=UPI00115202D9|nr:glycosyltransferase [Elioraea sp. Yellowstone]TQF76994.1 glycosyltransferase family 4 protein [Elioraea sp. Yellowstone]
MRVAIVHEWLDTYAGSERVLEQMLAVWPEADLYALCDFLPEAERGFLGGRIPRTTFIQRLPFARRRFRMYLGLMPLAIETLDLSGYDLVVSSSHAVAKGAITGPGTLHLAYVHSPMRYAWDLQAQYLREAGLERGLKGAYARWLLHRLRLWDHASAARPDAILANSRYIAERIRKVWRREAEVLHPPVDTDSFTPVAAKQDFYLIASRMVPYKRVDLAAASFRRMPDRRLVIVGDGPQMRAVRQAAGDAPNISFRGHVGKAELVALMQSARACLHIAEEDFGIAMVEAQACGTPMLAFGRGGSCDIVRTPEESDAPTGLLFAEQTAEALIEAVERFERNRGAFTPAACRANAERFSAARFRDGLRAAAARHLGHG